MPDLQKVKQKRRFSNYKFGILAFVVFLTLRLMQLQFQKETTVYHIIDGAFLGIFAGLVAAAVFLGILLLLLRNKSSLLIKVLSFIRKAR